MERELLEKLLLWARERKSLETDARPDVNIYKRILIETWNQVITKLEGELLECQKEKSST